MGILKFQNDDVTRKIETLGEIRNDATHEITKSKNGPEPAFSIYW